VTKEREQISWCQLTSV